MSELFECVGESVPTLDPAATPPVVLGMAALACVAYGGQGLDALLALVNGRDAPVEARLFDASLAYRVCFQAAHADSLQAEALALASVFRVAHGPRKPSNQPLRVLALVTAGDLMANTPLEFITAHLNVWLDLLFVCPDQPLPSSVPDHDVGFCAVGEPDAAMTQRLTRLVNAWPRPVVNGPAAIGRLSRDTVAAALVACPSILAPPTVRVTRAQLDDHLDGLRPLALLTEAHPTTIRPVGSHAGQGLERLDWPDDLSRVLTFSEANEFFIARFIDYRGGDGWFRKYRVALIEGCPHLCHMATSDRWMIHYLNAGMEEHAWRRDDEAAAMADFDAGFGRRHAAAFAWIARWLALDYAQIDCAEAPDGRLLVFEVDVAAIVHLMDPPDRFPYKPAAMHRVFDAFGAMLERRAGKG